MSKQKLKEVLTAETVEPHTLPLHVAPVVERSDVPLPRKFRVKLKDNPPVVVTARDGLDAIEQYQNYCGIIATPHKYEIDEVE